jgi:small subunit ribosomal protein S1
VKTAVLSREHAQRRCTEDYLSRLTPGDVIPARVTHLEPFGAFCDIGCGIIALMPIDTISVSRIEHPDERFAVGMDICAVVKSKVGMRITLSHKELLGTWRENAERFCVGETVTGVVRSIENYGAFVELTPNLAGLAELRDGLRVGQRVSVYIKNIIPERMKVKLTVIDELDGAPAVDAPEYFIAGGHIDRFLYSPEGCARIICTDFTDSG